MRSALAGLGLGALLALVGCTHLGQDQSGTSPGRPLASNEVPSSAQLIKYVNDNARMVQSLQCDDLFIDAKAPGGNAGVSGKLACEKPRNFRMTADIIGQPAVDIGSNNDEFWFWISRNEPPYVFHCSYEDFRRGVRTPFPFQPEWIIEALGIAEMDEAKAGECKVAVKPTSFELTEPALSAQGQPVRKVTVFNRTPSPSGKPQVTAHILQDANGKTICAAYVASVQWVQVSPSAWAVVPQRIDLMWPAEKMELKMKLDRVHALRLGHDQAVTMFSRNSLARLPSFDLARGAPEPAVGQMQRAGGTQR